MKLWEKRILGVRDGQKRVALKLVNTKNCHEKKTELTYCWNHRG